MMMALVVMMLMLMLMMVVVMMVKQWIDRWWINDSWRRFRDKPMYVHHISPSPSPSSSAEGAEEEERRGKKKQREEEGEKLKLQEATLLWLPLSQNWVWEKTEGRKRAGKRPEKVVLCLRGRLISQNESD
jgi:hypothetical protein